MKLTIVVYGKPKTQGSKKLGAAGQIINASPELAPWREAVKWAALEANNGTHPVEGPVDVTCAFTVPKPVGRPKRTRTWPTNRGSGDIDKLVRAVLDALTDAGIWLDDSQVIWLQASKHYPHEGLDALDKPGAVITVRTLE